MRCPETVLQYSIVTLHKDWKMIFATYLPISVPLKLQETSGIGPPVTLHVIVPLT